MKKLVLVILAMIFTIGLTALAHAAKEKFEAKAGDTIYVCGCGEGCKCGTLAKQDGTCACGQKLVKTTVNKVEKGKVFYTINGKELSASMTGKYYCQCEKCDCRTISQKEGKCGCGKTLVKMKKS